jgi:hypothetical protein
VFEGRELLNTPNQPKKQTTKPAADNKKTSAAKPNQAAPKAATRNLLNAPKANDQQKKQATRPAAAATTKATAAKPQEKKPKRALLGEF